MSETVLVRYGVIPEVGRFSYALEVRPERGMAVVVESHRGAELGTLLDLVRSAGPSAPATNAATNDDDGRCVLRVATSDDMATHSRLQREAIADYAHWQSEIRDWGLQLELIDVEWTLDQRKLILYVVGERGAETTKLALQAAASGKTAIEVQPVGAEGVISLPAEGGGGCGSGGCGCHE